MKWYPWKVFPGVVDRQYLIGPAGQPDFQRSVPDFYPSFSPLPRVRTLAYRENCICCLGRGRSSGSLIESKKTFVDRHRVHPPQTKPHGEWLEVDHSKNVNSGE
jgi:hypothetical protein